MAAFLEADKSASYRCFFKPLKFLSERSKPV
jgi:hypothetical protein